MSELDEDGPGDERKVSPDGVSRGGLEVARSGSGVELTWLPCIGRRCPRVRRLLGGPSLM